MIGEEEESVWVRHGRRGRHRTIGSKEAPETTVQEIIAAYAINEWTIRLESIAVRRR